MIRSDAPATYDDDFYAWTQAQAAALRAIPRQAIGDHVDIEHVAEEIEDLGKRDLREVESFLKRLVEHLVKIDACPGSPDRMHWFSEALNFQDSALAAFTPSMRHLIDVRHVWTRGQTLAAANLSEQGVTSVSVPCPLDLDELLTPDFDIKTALASVSAAKSKA